MQYMGGKYKTCKQIASILNAILCVAYLVSKFKNLSKDVVFSAGDYRLLKPRSGSLIYCDPPYVNTTSYKAAGSWDAEEFKSIILSWVRNCYVLVSERVAPEPFEPLAQFENRQAFRFAMHATESLFIHPNHYKEVLKILFP